MGNAYNYGSLQRTRSYLESRDSLYQPTPPMQKIRDHTIEIFMLILGFVLGSVFTLAVLFLIGLFISNAHLRA
jgi:hypothetical protein